MPHVAPRPTDFHQLLSPVVLASVEVAPTVEAMLACLLGVVIGLLILYGPLGVLTPQVDAALSSALEFAGRAISFILDYVNGATEQELLVEVLGIALGVATPGLLALLLVVAARASGSLRNALLLSLGLIAVLIGVSSWSQGGLILLALLTVAMGLIVIAQKGAALVAVALSTILGVRWVTLLFDRSNPVIAKPAARLLELTNFADQNLWAAGLVVLGLAPFIGAAMRLLRD